MGTWNLHFPNLEEDLEVFIEEDGTIIDIEINRKVREYVKANLSYFRPYLMGVASFTQSEIDSCSLWMVWCINDALTYKAEIEKAEMDKK